MAHDVRLSDVGLGYRRRRFVALLIVIIGFALLMKENTETLVEIMLCICRARIQRCRA